MPASLTRTPSLALTGWAWTAAQRTGGRPAGLRWVCAWCASRKELGWGLPGIDAARSLLIPRPEKSGPARFTPPSGPRMWPGARVALGACSASRFPGPGFLGREAHRLVEPARGVAGQHRQRHRRALGVGLFQQAGQQATAQPLALERGIDLDLHQAPAGRIAIRLEQAGGPAMEPDNLRVAEVVTDACQMMLVVLGTPARARCSVMVALRSVSRKGRSSSVAGCKARQMRFMGRTAGERVCAWLIFQSGQSGYITVAPPAPAGGLGARSGQDCG